MFTYTFEDFCRDFADYELVDGPAIEAETEVAVYEPFLFTHGKDMNGEELKIAHYSKTIKPTGAIIVGLRLKKKTE